MASRHCAKCVENWPQHHLSCPICAAPLTLSGSDPMPDWEYKWLIYTGGKRGLDSLPKKEQDQCDVEWASLEAEATRRGLSMVDCLELGFRPGRKVT